MTFIGNPHIYTTNMKISGRIEVAHSAGSSNLENDEIVEYRHDVIE